MNTRFTFIVLILLEITSILTQHPTCRNFDFSDPLTLNQFGPVPNQFCGSHVGRMVIRSYNDSSIIPLRSSSRYFLSRTTWQFCMSSLTRLEGNASFIFKMAYFLQGPTNNSNSVDISLYRDNGSSHVASIHHVTNEWNVYEVPFSHSGIIRISGALDSRNIFAVEYIHIYDPQVTDENCVPTVTSTSTTTSTTTASPKLCRWEPGHEIAIGSRCDVQHGFFVFQFDGNAVIYDLNNVPIWNTVTAGIGHTFVFETNGNLVMYSSTGADVWNSASSNVGGSLLVFQEDRNLVIYNTASTPAVALWNTVTSVP